MAEDVLEERESSLLGVEGEWFPNGLQLAWGVIGGTHCTTIRECGLMNQRLSLARPASTVTGRPTSERS
jgi:hypothetical protein